MFKFKSVISIGLPALIFFSIFAAPIRSSDIQEFLKAPVWYLEYDVSFKATSAGTNTYVQGPMQGSVSYKTSLDLSFSAGRKLDLRSDGPSTILGMSALSGAGSGTRPSPAEAMQQMQTVMARMKSAANWINGGGVMGLGNNASDEELAAASKANFEASLGLAKIDYSRVDAGINLVNPMHEGTYNMTSHATKKGTGKVRPGVDGFITFEVDAAAKKYMLIIPFNFDDVDSKAKWETITTTERIGEAPVETQDSSEGNFSSFPDKIFLDDPKNLLTNFALVSGEIDPTADKITGERSMGAHYDDEREGPVAGTLVFRYTLTMTPPVKTAAKGK